MKERLIDEYIILVHPVIWGEGRKLFDGLEDRINLNLIKTRIFKSGVVVLRYESKG